MPKKFIKTNLRNTTKNIINVRRKPSKSNKYIIKYLKITPIITPYISANIVQNVRKNELLYKSNCWFIEAISEAIEIPRLGALAARAPRELT